MDELQALNSSLQALQKLPQIASKLLQEVCLSCGREGSQIFIEMGIIGLGQTTMRINPTHNTDWSVPHIRVQGKTNNTDQVHVPQNNTA